MIKCHKGLYGTLGHLSARLLLLIENKAKLETRKFRIEKEGDFNDKSWLRRIFIDVQ